MYVTYITKVILKYEHSLSRSWDFISSSGQTAIVQIHVPWVLRKCVYFVQFPSCVNQWL